MMSKLLLFHHHHSFKNYSRSLVFTRPFSTQVSKTVEASVLDGSNREGDELFQDDELIKSIRIERNQNTNWRRISEKPRVSNYFIIIISFIISTRKKLG